MGRCRPTRPRCRIITDVNQRLGFEHDNYRIEFWVQNLFDSDSPRAAFRDVSFNNTHLLQGSPEVPANRPPQEPYGGLKDMFPFRLSVSHPKLRTAGVTVRWSGSSSPRQFGRRRLRSKCRQKIRGSFR